MSVGQLIESVQKLPDSEFLILRQVVLEQENIRHLQIQPAKETIYMDLRQYLPVPERLSREDEEKLRP